MRVVQPEGQRGSLKWIQQAVAWCPELLQPPGLPAITWLSPLRQDGFAEYRDAAFLERLGLTHLSGSLKDFWPKGGPQWDALGLTSRGPVLVEAKAHLREFFSPGTMASAASRARIEAAFREVQQDLGLKPRASWADVYYQYANRLAFLWWLHKQGVAAELVFVSFLNDRDIGGPESAETWHAAFAGADHVLGLPARHRLAAHVHHVMPDVRQIEMRFHGGTPQAGSV
ncbi:MAG: hypothetical protein JNK19_02555 [Tabrizicola sp.]|nr:hypothetical protein [Tabrizicola sp.]